MPRYDYECAVCRTITERLLPMALSDSEQRCATCLQPMVKVFLTAPMGIVSNIYQPYKCPITGEVIDGKKAHTENLAKHNCRVLEGGEFEAAQRFRRESDEALDRGVEETVEREIALMPTEKKETLANELASGTTATVERH